MTFSALSGSQQGHPGLRIPGACDRSSNCWRMDWEEKDVFGAGVSTLLAVEGHFVRVCEYTDGFVVVEGVVTWMGSSSLGRLNTKFPVLVTPLEDDVEEVVGADWEAVVDSVAVSFDSSFSLSSSSSSLELVFSA